MEYYRVIEIFRIMKKVPLMGWASTSMIMVMHLSVFRCMGHYHCQPSIILTAQNRQILDDHCTLAKGKMLNDVLIRDVRLLDWVLACLLFDWLIDWLIDWLSDGLNDRLIHGWIDGWMDGWMDRWIDGSMDRWINQSINQSINWWINGWIVHILHLNLAQHKLYPDSRKCGYRLGVCFWWPIAIH